MSVGFDAPVNAMDAAQRRRQMAADAAPAPQWSQPQENSFGGAGTYASSGDPTYDFIRNQAVSDAGARTVGLRSAARSASPNDPALAGWASLQGLLGGQGDAARMVNAGALNWAQEMNRRKWEEYIMRLKQQWAKELQDSQNGAGLWNTVGQVAGAVGSAALG